MLFTIEGSIQGQKCSQCGEWGYAEDTLNAAKNLKDNGIKYNIYPDFKYDINAL